MVSINQSERQKPALKLWAWTGREAYFATAQTHAPQSQGWFQCRVRGNSCCHFRRYECLRQSANVVWFDSVDLFYRRARGARKSLCLTAKAKISQHCKLAHAITPTRPFISCQLSSSQLARYPSERAASGKWMSYFAAPLQLPLCSSWRA